MTAAPDGIAAALGAGQRPRVAVVGAGISGLTVAHGLATHPQLGGQVDVTVFDAASRVGGKLLVRSFAGHQLDLGAEAFLTRGTEVEELADELGLADQLVAPATSSVSLVRHGELHPLPEGTILGVPTRIGPLVRSGAVSLRGALRAAADLILPREPRVEDRSVADLVAERFGPEIVEVLVEPLLGGVYAGDPAQLGVRATTPLLFEAARSHRSLLLGLRAARRAAAGDRPPVFRTLRGGMGSLTATLEAWLEDAAQVTIRRAAPVQLVEPHGGGWCVTGTAGDELEVDAVVLAVPAYVAGALLREVAPTAAAALRDIRYASVATIALAYPRGAVDHPLDGSGLLVPRTEGRDIKAATFVTSKWPHQHDEERAIVRASIGRVGDGALERTDDQLATAAHRDLRELLGIRSAPEQRLVTRWERALPQYGIGHAAVVAEVRAELAERGGPTLVGAAYDGVGIAACVANGRRVAQELLGAAAGG